jgi:hypothetical protein
MLLDCSANSPFASCETGVTAARFDGARGPDLDETSQNPLYDSARLFTDFS